MVNENEDVVVVNEDATVIDCYILVVIVDDDAMINMHVVNEVAAVVNIVSVTLVVILEI